MYIKVNSQEEGRGITEQVTTVAGSLLLLKLVLMVKGFGSFELED